MSNPSPRPEWATVMEAAAAASIGILTPATDRTFTVAFLAPSITDRVRDLSRTTA